MNKKQVSYQETEIAIQEIISELKRLSLEPLTQPILDCLAELTAKLIGLKMSVGELSEDPLNKIKNIPTAINPLVREKVRDKTILITGGSGTVGRELISKLLEFSPKKIIIVDCNETGNDTLLKQYVAEAQAGKIQTYLANIVDYERLNEVFLRERPEIVFHVAAERLPERAEKFPKAAAQANIIGTYTLCALADQYKVEYFIHASTGKCRNIYDERIYPLTKKYGEIIVRLFAESNSTKYGMVRFHSIVENSIAEEIYRQQAKDIRRISPYTSVTKLRHSQTVHEAGAMLLNSLLYADRAEIFGSNQQQQYYLPLDIALYTILSLGEKLPLVFKPHGEGHEADCPGTRRTDDPRNISHAFHTIETESLTEYPEDRMVSVPFPVFDQSLARQKLEEIFKKIDGLSDEEVRVLLISGMEDLARSTFAQASVDLVADSVISGVQSMLKDTSEEVLESLYKHKVFSIAVRGPGKAGSYKNSQGQIFWSESGRICEIVILDPVRQIKVNDGQIVTK
jgi:nucleoside-diphosphate-sugar epimerase